MYGAFNIYWENMGQGYDEYDTVWHVEKIMKEWKGGKKKKQQIKSKEWK